MNIVNSKQVQQSNALRCVVCTTVKLPDFGCNVIHSFVRYHLKIGFKHVYIFFDDINDGGIKIVKKQFSNDEVTIIPNDDNLKFNYYLPSGRMISILSSSLPSSRFLSPEKDSKSVSDSPRSRLARLRSGSGGLLNLRKAFS